MFEVNYFQNSNGEKPVEIFIRALPKKDRTKVLKTINLLREYGPYLAMPHVKKLDRNLWELRISGFNCIYRTFYTNRQRRFYLLHIFKKKSEKTPKKELDLAIDRIKEAYG